MEIDSARSIQKIFSFHQLGEPVVITPLSGGMVNAVFDVNGHYIIRFNLRDKQINKFEREAASYNTLQGIIPTPKLIAYDNSRGLVDCEFIILEKLQGTSLGTIWGELSPAEKEQAAFEVGQILGRMHTVKIGAGFGRLEDRSFQTWSDYIHAYVEKQLALAHKLDCLGKDLSSAIERVVAKANWLISVQTPSLVHNDFHFYNLHIHQGAINGVYDFEWTTAGDPVLDLKDLLFWDEDFTGSRKPFETGYRSIRDLPADFEQRIRFYQLIYTLELIPVSFQHWGRESYHETLEHLQNQIKAFDCLSDVKS